MLVKEKKITKITFETYTGIILDDGKSIKDNITSLIFKNVFDWIEHTKKYNSSEKVVGKETTIEYYLNINKFHYEYNYDFLDDDYSF